MSERFKIRMRENWYRDVWLLVITAIVFYALSEQSRTSSETAKLALANRELLERFESDSSQRRNESCRYFELQETAGVQRVKTTYSFLDKLPRRDWGSPLTQAIVRQLPSTYADALANRAPSYCNKMDNGRQVGLPEPGPTLPKLRSFKYMLQR